MYIHNKTYSRKMALLMLFIVVNSTPMHYELKRRKNYILKNAKINGLMEGCP